MAMTGPNNYSLGAAADLGLGAASGVTAPSPMQDDEMERKKKLLQAQREKMGLSGASVYGAASMTLFGGGAPPNVGL